MRKARTTINDLSPALQEIMREMCRRVGADPEEINFKEPYWFHKYTWTSKEEEDFINWLTDRLAQNKEWREELLEIPTKNRKLLKQAARMFALNYGWKIEPNSV